MTAPSALNIVPFIKFPLIEAPCDLGELILKSVRTNGPALQQGDVLVVAHKIVSKSEGSVVDLRTVKPSQAAVAMAQRTHKDARLVEVILSQSKRIVREARGVIITENLLGLICANAGVDQSNAGEHQVVVLPENPDRSAQALHIALKNELNVELPVLVADTHGRPWREGAVGLCIGLAGIDPFLDYRGTHDLYAYEMQTEVECVADEICAAATLVMGQGNEGVPLAQVRGLCVQAKAASSAQLLRDSERDLFR